MQQKLLWELQRVDQSLEKITREIKQKELVMLLKEKQNKIKELEAIIEKEEKERADLENKSRAYEDELANLETKKQAQKEKLYNGSTNSPKELESMKVKLDEIKERISQLEDQALANMDILEDKVQLLNRHTSLLNELKKEYIKNVKLYQKNKTELNEKMTFEEKRRAELVSMLSDNLLSLYQRAQEKFKNRGIARAEKGLCSGCRVEIPIMHLQNIKLGNNIYTCEQCGRILIWDEPETGC
ncbi:MAG: hypothetical protein GXW85_07090 [Clostridia bacterium]|nr:hypothetical protein [Clostridia bacterium]